MATLYILLAIALYLIIYTSYVLNMNKKSQLSDAQHKTMHNYSLVSLIASLVLAGIAGSMLYAEQYGAAWL